MKWKGKSLKSFLDVVVFIFVFVFVFFVFLFFFMYLLRDTTLHIKKYKNNYLGGGPVVRAWDQEVCFLYGLRFEPCGGSYDGHWRLTWSLTSGLVGLVEVRASWPRYPR